MTSDHSLLGDPIPKIERRNFFFQSTNIYGYCGKIWVDAHGGDPQIWLYPDCTAADDIKPRGNDPVSGD